VKGRTRKVVTLYAGKEAVYAMSEGNPRWLLGLLNDLADLGTSLSDFFAKGMTNVRYGDQARILSNAAHRFLSQVNATPSRVTGGNSSLVGFVDSIGEAFQKWLYGKDFPVDPIGSFEVSRETDPVIIQTVEQLLELGALIHIGTSQQSVPRQITGSRFRLTFMLAPVFKLPFRTYRPVKLSDALSGKTDPDQLELSLESEE